MAIEALEAACKLSFEEGCKKERQIAKAALGTPQAGAMIHPFFAERALSKVPGLSGEVEPYPIQKVGIAGAGTMGGGTLVIQTTGLRDDLWLDANGNPLTSAAKMTEKLQRPNYGTLKIKITIDDPTVYTAPWTVKLTQPLVLDSELLDYYCLENEKDFAHMQGK